MNEQERQVIDDIFRRLEQVANQPRDPEAERFIAEKLRQQPYAPYAMAQAVFVQEQALTNLQAENEQLREALTSRSTVDQAIGILMARHACNATIAFGMLRAASQARNRKLRDVAVDLLTATGGPPTAPTPFTDRST